MLRAPGEGTLPILYEDRSVLAVDKPAGWMLIPFNWQKTQWNLQAALNSSIAAGDFWARSRNLKFLRNIHRLDAETSGVLLFAKSPGALATYASLFETRRMEKRYLTVVVGRPACAKWVSQLPLAPDPAKIGRMRVDQSNGKSAETHFKLLRTTGGKSLVEARPVTGRTHQIRVHLAETVSPVLGDELYGGLAAGPEVGLALRAVELAYFDPFQRRPVRIQAPDASHHSVCI